eukprot:TRINITY_DN29715_c0_g1_i4.p1 TRINITY_DN29715_c0_g1~~TRINITY_DN29715_c0_g1_i4.p1  ORF type:complete len:188 (-),score=19.59 TRINITY_DN29715_c0_g1_i4:785-1348(-)
MPSDLIEPSVHYETISSGDLIVSIEDGPSMKELYNENAGRFCLPPEIRKYFNAPEDPSVREMEEGLRVAYLNLSGCGAPSELMVRIMANTRVATSIDLVDALQIPMQLIQAKHIIQVRRHSVRVLWYSYILPVPLPGATAGPFVLKVTSDNLASGSDSRKFDYVVRRAKQSSVPNMAEYILGDMTLQ